MTTKIQDLGAYSPQIAKPSLLSRVEERHELQLPLSVRIVKRGLDISIAGLGLLVLAPLFPILALLITLDSPGPIFYRQRRASGIRFAPRSRQTAIQPRFHEFSMLKFRTMRPDAERLTGAVLAGERDQRVTRIGRFLRKVRLDEVPQLLNVLRGEMSIVGPRPERPELFADLVRAIPYFEERVRGLKPGITGLAQVRGCRGETARVEDMEARVMYDLEYMRNWSPVLDLQILLATVAAVVKTDRAY
jgi:lipopolysaccharide/colanic/teichoic acid biosynthesis glycosyltransferase